MAEVENPCETFRNRIQSCSGKGSAALPLPEGDFIPFRNVFGRVSTPSMFIPLTIRDFF